MNGKVVLNAENIMRLAANLPMGNNRRRINEMTFAGLVKPEVKIAQINDKKKLWSCLSRI